MPKTPNSKSPKNQAPLFKKTMGQVKKLQKQKAENEKSYQPEKTTLGTAQKTPPRTIASHRFFHSPQSSSSSKKTASTFSSPEFYSSPMWPRSMGKNSIEPEPIKHPENQTTVLPLHIDSKPSFTSSSINPPSAKKSLEKRWTSPVETIETTVASEETLEEIKKKSREQAKEIKPRIVDNSLSSNAIKQTLAISFTGLECVTSSPKKQKREKPSKQRLQEIGYRGEAIAYAHLCRKYAKPDIKITWHNEITESELPYDISIVFPEANGETSQHYFEVKSTTGIEKNEYTKLRLSDNETAHMRLHGEKYHLLRLYAVETDSPIIEQIDGLWQKQFGPQEGTVTPSLQPLVMSFKLKL